MRPSLRTGVAVLAAAAPLALGAPAVAAPTTAPGSHAVHTIRATLVPTGVTRSQWKRVHVLRKALALLRTCESSGRYGLNSGNGYYGAYQFLPSTWHSLGYKGLPNRASKAVQDAAAARLHDRRGSWADWGYCGRKAAGAHA